MSKAEDAALRVFPDYPTLDGGYVSQRKQRSVFIKGYKHALGEVRCEIERRLRRENEILWNAKLRGTYASPSCEYNLLTLTSMRDFIDGLTNTNTEKIV